MPLHWALLLIASYRLTLRLTLVELGLKVIEFFLRSTHLSMKFILLINVKIYPAHKC